MNSKLSRYMYCAALAIGLGSAALPAVSAHREHPQDQPAAARQTDATQRPASPEGAGAAKFKEHCSRCHEAPQGFSSRISGTILRHMRVRASLSTEDERDILRFLNP